MTYKGECFCGAIRIEVTGDPEGMGYCHCRSCRSWSGGPVNAFTLWKPDAVRVPMFQVLFFPALGSSISWLLDLAGRNERENFVERRAPFHSAPDVVH